MLDVGSVKTLINYKELKDIIFSIIIENKKVLIDTTAGTVDCINNRVAIYGIWHKFISY